MPYQNSGRAGGGKPRRFRGWLRDTPTLARLAEQTQALTTWQQRAQTALPAELAGQWQLAEVTASRVTVSVPSPAWASRLRFYEQTIRQALAEAVGETPRHCRFVVATPAAAKQRQPPHQLSANAAAAIASAARTADNPRLQAALHRLASRH